jgi:hypothetical protein
MKAAADKKEGWKEVLALIKEKGLAKLPATGSFTITFNLNQGGLTGAELIEKYRIV